MADLNGVFSEGDDVELLCRVPTGKPVAHLSWHVDAPVGTDSPFLSNFSHHNLQNKEWSP